MSKKNNKKIEGITLIALVVTIIVLLILAGVAIALTVGNNGLFTRAEGASKEYSKAEVKEELEMLVGDIQVDLLLSGKGYISEETEEILTEKGAIILDRTEEIILGEYKDYEFTIDKDGNITIGDKLAGEKPTGEAELITTEDGIEEAQILVTGNHEEGIEEIRTLNGAELVEDKGEEGLIYKVTENGTYNFLIRANNGRNLIVSITVNNIMKSEVDIFTAIEKTTNSTKKKIRVVGSENAEIYGLNIVHIKGDTELGDELLVNGEAQNIEGISKAEKVYSVGSQEDVAQGTEDAQNTAVLKVEGNLTISEGVKLTSVASSSGLGGPKGLIIYCTGTLTNNGEISMTARGAKAVGQNVYLYKNSDDTFEYIPALGGAGGASVTQKNPNGSGKYTNGIAGTNGSNRGTGGGGSGRAFADMGGDSKSGAGAQGTSYSGGSGGGAASGYHAGATGGAATGNGGKGGNGGQASGNLACGGAGNPGGAAAGNSQNDLSKGTNGTGGLLVIFASNIEGTGTATSAGSNGGYTGASGARYKTSGGSSGGGSINIFVKNENPVTVNWTFNVNGGSVSGSGAGGAGTKTIGRIWNEEYIPN